MFSSISGMLGYGKKEGPPLEPMDPKEFMKELNASKLDYNKPAKAVCQRAGAWHVYDDKKNIEKLNAGDSLFSFMCCVGGQGECGDVEKQIISSYSNLTSFMDELEENNVPPIDIFTDEEAAQYTIVMTRAAYLMKDVTPEDFTPEMYGLPEYHKMCQPGNISVCEEVPDDTTFRITKTFISMIWKMTLQLKCSYVNPLYLEKLSRVDGGIPVKNAILMERTKRNITVLDATRKVKTILIFSPVEGGVLVQMTTMVFNSVVPSYASKIIHNLGSFGSGEVADTATKARNHIRPFMDKAKLIIKAKKLKEEEAAKKKEMSEQSESASKKEDTNMESSK